MTELQQILTRLDQISDKIDAISNGYMKIPEASKYFRIGVVKLRELCDSGIIPASLINEGASKKHWIIPVAEAKTILQKGGYLHKMIQDREPRKRKFKV